MLWVATDFNDMYTRRLTTLKRYWPGDKTPLKGQEVMLYEPGERMSVMGKVDRFEGELIYFTWDEDSFQHGDDRVPND